MNDILYLLGNNKRNEYQEKLLNNNIKQLASSSETVKINDDYIRVIVDPYDGNYIVVVLDKYGRIIDEIFYEEV